MCQSCPPSTNARKAKSKRKPKRSVDPTGTTALRGEYERALAKRWRMVLKEIIRAVVDRNGFGLVANRRFAFDLDAEKAASFQDWLSGILNKYLFDGDDKLDPDKRTGRFWGNTFANIAYRRGLLGAVNQVRRQGGRVAKTFIEGAMSRGQHADTIGRIYARQYDALKSITSEMSRQIGEVIAETLSQGKGYVEIAKAITDRVEKVGIYRSAVLARTEVISAYNEAELNTYADAGIDGVEMQPELLTAGDDRVCEKCDEAARGEYTVATARGVLPIHPNCRCAWSPVIVNAEWIDLS